LEKDGGYTHHAGQVWRAEPDSGSLDGPIKSITYASSSNAHLFVYLCKDPAFYGVIGLAWVGTICGPNSWKGYKASINEKRQNVVSTAKVVAHEMGHNMGMLHDFDNVHGGSGSSCNGQGLMSYGNTPGQWSTCSRNDYLARYNQVGGYNWCMAAAPSACGGSTTPEPPTPTPPPPPSTGCAPLAQYPSWYQDKYCDDIFNTPECNYDGGDCCIQKRWNWHQYCSECQCKGWNCPSYGTSISTGWWGDKWCDDGFNTAGCMYDGGDCCPPHSFSNWNAYCSTCACNDALASATSGF